MPIMQEPRESAQQRARRGSQCRPANRSPECAPARLTQSDAAPSPKETRRAAGAPRRAPAPFTSRADHQKTTRSAPWQDRAIQKPGVAGTHAAPPVKASQGASSPAAGVPDPRPPAESAQGPSAAARAPPEPVYAHQPLAGVCAGLASRRAPPRRAQNRRAHLSRAARTTDAERV